MKHWSALTPPHIHILIGSDSDFCDFVWREADYSRDWVVRVLQGSRMRTEAGLFQEVAAALQFPYYFGANWNAVDDCLTDLEWLPAEGYLVCVTNANDVLADRREAFSTFMRVLLSSAEFWGSEPNSLFQEASSRVRTPFHVLLHCRPADHSQLSELLENLAFTTHSVTDLD